MRPYDYTDEETCEIIRADVKCQLAPKRPEPKELIDSKAVQHFVEFLEHPSQYELNKADDYTHCLTKQLKKIRTSSRASRKRDVPQLKE